MSDRKPRSDSKLDSMPESRVLELRDMLMAGASHRNVLDWLAVECGVSVSTSALTSFYKRHCVPVLRDKRRLAAVKAEAIVDDAGRTDWNTATMELVKQVSFEIMSGEQIDTKTAEKFIKLVLKADAQATDKDKLNAATKTKVEAGLDAMHEEIKDNPAALRAFSAMKEALKL